MSEPAAVREPEAFAGLILLTPPSYFTHDLEVGYQGRSSVTDIEELLGSLEANYPGWSGAMAPVNMGNPQQPELGEELTNSFCCTDPEIARVTFLSDNHTDLANVAMPTLVAQCPSDAITPPEVGAFIHAQVPGSRLVTLDATGHRPQLAAPEETAATFAGILQ